MCLQCGRPRFNPWVRKIFWRRKWQLTPVFFFSFLFFFNWKLITLQYYSGFCHTLTWVSHGCTCVPHPEPPTHLPPHPIPQGHPSAPALSTLSHALNLNWWSILCMIIRMFQCCSLKSSHPRLLPQSPKNCLYICVSFAVLHIGSSLPSFWIPYICVNILYWCFSLWLTSLCIIGPSFTHLIRTDSNALFLMAE